MNLTDVKGLKAKRLEALNKAGINTPSDLLMTFPTKYAFTENANPKNFNDGEEILIKGRVQSVKSVYAKNKMYITRAKIESADSRIFDAVWYNMKYISTKLNGGEQLYFFGKVKVGTTPQLSVPEILEITSDKIIPLYKTVKGVSQKTLKEAINIFLDEIEICGFIPQKTEAKYGVFSLNNAIRIIHRPASQDALKKALTSVQLNFLTYYISLISLNGDKFSQKRRFFYEKNTEILPKVIKSLPFCLTDDQRKVVEQIIVDLGSRNRLNRLVMGDVGCGKTMVAFLAMYYAVASGYQTAIMVPTEILANQHFLKATEFFLPLGVGTAILTGSQTAAEKRENLFKIKSGAAQVIVGTHSLISENVDFNNLSLIVIDEQHRFGVNQRAALEEKAEGVDILVMSATPIPRTLALTLYGNLEKSEIRTMPSQRRVVVTKFVPAAKVDSMIEYLISEAEAGNQTYIVCPRIEDEENYGVESFYRKLKSRYNNCACLHGKMKEAEKNSAITAFAYGKIGILVSTTVIEVGVDVAGAVNMVIFDAERFGLSQLHQLRGRVGRREKQGYCYVLTDNKEAYESRIKIFCNTTDGFALAEEDFRLRGAGDFFGTRQHGASSFGVIDSEMIEKAKLISDDVLSDEHLREEIALRYDKEGDFIRSITLN